MARLPFSFRALDPLPDTDYVILDKDGLVDREARPLGRGGAGVVYLALFKGQMQRAVKILAPEAEMLRGEMLAAFTRTFQNEVIRLARVSHTRIAKIMDADEVSLAGQKYPYFAMDFVHGNHFLDALAHPAMRAGDFLDVFDQVLDGVEYLHLLEIMHSDLKNTNVVVQKSENTGFSSTILDLGVAKSINPAQALPDELAFPARDELPGLPLPRRTTFFSSQSITHEVWKPRLNTNLTRRQLREMFPTHDLYGLGRLLQGALHPRRPLRDRLQQDLGAGGITSLRQIVNRLLADPSSDDYHYKTVTELRSDWRKLAPSYVAPLQVPELAIGARAKTSIALPTGRVSLTERLLNIVNHPLFQRLRHIPQLEFVSLIYPGGSHSRLLHSLTTFDTARRYVSHLLNDPSFRLMVEPHEVEATLLWALLHDVGHYPLSHMFEDFAELDKRRIADRKRAKKSATRRTVPTDEDLFWSFVAPDRAVGTDFEDYAGAIEAALRRLPAGSRTTLDRHLREQQFDDEVMGSLWALAHPTRPSESVLAGLISSPIDVDKVAYLLDDSTLTGVRYGLGIDLDALLGSLRAPEPNDITPPERVIAISDKGLPAAEAVVLARYWMLRRVYWHHANRAVMAMVKFVVGELLKIQQFEMRDYFRRTMFDGAREAAGHLSRSFDRAEKTGEIAAKGQVVNPLHGLMLSNRAIYKRLLSVSRGPGDRDRRLYDHLFRHAHEGDEIREAAQAAIEESLGRPVRHGDVLIDIPVRAREALGDELVVYLQRSPTVGRPITAVSPLLAQLGAEFDQHVKKCRVFVHPEVARELAGKEARARRAAADHLSACCR